MEIVVHQRRRRHRLGSALLTAACVLVTLLALAFIVPALFGLQRYVINGTSMTGTIDYGSVAVEEVVPVSQLRVGDIITYQPPPGSGVDHLVTHRIVAIHGDVMRTRGDAVPQRDPWKFKLDSNRQSRVVLAVPYAGYPLIWLADRGVRILAISVPAGIIAVISLVQLFRAVRPQPRTRPGRPSIQA